MNFGERLAISSTLSVFNIRLLPSFVSIYMRTLFSYSSQQMLLLWERRPFRIYSLHGSSEIMAKEERPREWERAEKLRLAKREREKRKNT